MKKILSDNRILIVKRGVSLVAVFAVLVVALVAPNWSFGWFAKNNVVTANGMTTQAYHSKFRVYYSAPTVDGDGEYVMNGDEYVYGAYTELPSNGTIPVLDKLKAPGDTVEFKIKIQNIGSRSVLLQGFGLEAPTADEDLPKFDGAIAYYLSTEIQTALKAVGITSYTASSAMDLRGGGFSGAVNAPSYTPATSAGRIDYMAVASVPAITLASEGTVEFTITMTFEDSNYNQNVFKNFGGGGANGNCSRRLFFTYDEQ